MQAQPDSAIDEDNTALRQLLLEEDEDFIEAAYLALLKRRPDARGGAAYLRDLRNGTRKEEILYKLYTSDESRRIGADLPGLTQVFASHGMGDFSGAAARAAKILRAEQLLVIGDAEEFIALAYQVLLKRPADKEGAANRVARMKDGVAKTQILHELFTSPECRRLGTELPGLREAFRREGLDLPAGADPSDGGDLLQPAKTLDELLALQGDAFLECAHVTLLNRPAPPETLHRQAERLHDREAKLELLDELASSREGAAGARRVAGLSAALQRRHLGRLPIVGGLVRLLLGGEGNSLGERRLRASEQRLAALEAMVRRELGRLEQDGLRADEVARQRQDAAHDLEVRVASLERSTIALRQLFERCLATAPDLQAGETSSVPPEPAGQLALDVRTEEVFRDLHKVKR